MIVGLQLLRFIAASLVILNHAMGEFPGVKAVGSFGVDIFFVISGFIISQITTSGTKDFFKKRLIRIVPLYWLFTAFVAAIGYFAPHLLRSARWDPVHLLASLFFVPQWTEAMTFEPILKLGWTLNLEIYFYLLFFLATKVSERHRELVCSVLLVILFATFSLLPLAPTSAFNFYAQDITLEFIFGMGLALLYRQRHRIFLATPRLVNGVLVVTSSAAFYYTTRVSDFNLVRCIIYGLPALVCVFSFLSLESAFKQLPQWAQSMCLAGGELSYPMYLIHMYAVAAISRLAGGKSMGYTAIFAVAWLASVALSRLVIDYYDAPIRRLLTGRLARRAPA